MKPEKPPEDLDEHIVRKDTYKGNPIFYNKEDHHYYVYRDCDVCESKHYADKSKLKTECGRGTTCSRSCGAKKGSSKKERKYDTYKGKEVFRDENRKPYINRECDICGNQYKARIDHLERDGNHGLTCSRSCGRKHAQITRGPYPNGVDHGNWKGGYEPYYGDNWSRMRKKALERDNYACRVCGKGKDELGKNPDVHHVQPVRTFSTPENANTLDNLITLCKEHHSSIEGWGLKPDI